MATLVNKMNREVKVIIPNMREFRVFYSDNEGSVMFFKRDWVKETTKENWKPSEEQLDALRASNSYWKDTSNEVPRTDLLETLYNDLEKLIAKR